MQILQFDCAIVTHTYSWACMYSLLSLPSYFLWVYEVILTKHGCHFKKQQAIKVKELNILIYHYYLLVRTSSMYLLSKFELKFHHITPK